MRTPTASVLFALLVLALLAGCGTRQKDAGSGATGQSTAPGMAPAPAANNALAEALPQEIDRLTDQVIIYECPKCARMYDQAGDCPRDGARLYPTKVTYICPYDGVIAAHYGRCPQCGRMVAIEKAKILPGGIRVVREN